MRVADGSSFAREIRTGWGSEQVKSALHFCAVHEVGDQEWTPNVKPQHPNWRPACLL